MKIMSKEWKKLSRAGKNKFFKRWKKADRRQRFKFKTGMDIMTKAGLMFRMVKTPYKGS